MKKDRYRRTHPKYHQKLHVHGPGVKGIHIKHDYLPFEILKCISQFRIYSIRTIVFRKKQNFYTWCVHVQPCNRVAAYCIVSLSVQIIYVPVWSTHIEDGDDGGVVPADYGGNVLRLGDLR